MSTSELERPASLSVWSPARRRGAVPARDFSTLRDALGAAVDALRESGARPWIVTERGAVLSPGWIGAHVGKPT